MHRKGGLCLGQQSSCVLIANRAFDTLTESLSRGHTLVFITALFYLMSAIYSPLGGAFFNVAPATFKENVTILQNTVADWNLYGLYHDAIPAFYAVGVSFESLGKLPAWLKSVIPVYRHCWYRRSLRNFSDDGVTFLVLTRCI
jgi:hypothetical protein